MTVLARFLLLALIAFSDMRPAEARPPAWEVDPAASRIVFTFLQMGGEVSGRFHRFDAAIRFDPAGPEGEIAVIIDVASLDTGEDQRDREARGRAFFDVEAFPTARFHATEIVGADGRFQATGTLTIRDVTRPVRLPFTLTLSGDRAVADGRTEISRSDFGLGTGNADLAAVIGDPVVIELHVEARRR